MWRHTMWSTRAVVMTLGLLAAPAAGQFREIPPQQPRSAKLKLAPTDQPFVAPPTPEETLSATGDAPADPEPGASNTPAPNAPDSPGVPPATKSDQPPAANPTDGTEPQGQLAPVVSPPTGRAPVVSSSDRPVTPRSDMTPAAPPKASESTASEPPAAPIAPSDQTSQGKPVPSESGTSDAIASEEQQSPPADAQESWRAALPVPESDAKPAPVAFNKIEPGRSLISDVRAKWGEPLDQVSLGEELWLLYRVPGFEQVDVAQAADGQTVRSIVIHLQQPVAIADLERRYGFRRKRRVRRSHRPRVS